MASPDAEVHVDEGLVRALLVEQHPDLADRPLVELDAGWDNLLWRLGDDLLVRLPRRAVAVPLVEHEQRWLPVLAPELPLPVPAPVRVGRPSGAFPWPWSVLPWIDGTPADRTPPSPTGPSAERLGRFLGALHRPAPDAAPRSPLRGVPLAVRAPTFEERLAALAAEVDVPALRAGWDRALAAAPHPGPPRWVHGDLHPANVLVADGDLAAVIDFGDLGAGDPATDVAAAWMLLPTEAHPRFADAYGRLDADLAARGRGWALLFGLMLLGIGLADRPTYEAVGRRTLARALDGGLPG